MSVTPTVRSSPLTDDSHVDTAATRGVLLELLEERRRQIDEHGWSPAHDDEHATFDFAWLIGRRAMEMCNPMSADVVDCRRLLVEIAAIAVAAIEAIDRKDAREVPHADQASL
jgi:hypothetical protein